MINNKKHQTNPPTMLPTCSSVWRIDDGEKFSRNQDGTYSMANSSMQDPHKYSFKKLMDTKKFSVYPPIDNITIKKLENLLQPYLILNLECDGMARITSYLLKEENIDHQLWCGELIHKPTSKKLVHFWIEYNIYIVDYKVNMWFDKIGNIPSDTIPNGIFISKEYPDFEYCQYEQLKPTSKHIFKLLTMNFKHDN